MPFQFSVIPDDGMPILFLLLPSALGVLGGEIQDTVMGKLLSQAYFMEVL